MLRFRQLTQGLRLSSRALSSEVLNGNNSESIIESALGLRQLLQPLNDGVQGPLEKSSQKNTVLPFVFLLGNHSSGKSSFLNYVFQRKVQTAGVAPTDDNFTIVVPGPADGDRDGPAFIGDPDMGFSGLRSFGPSLIHHTCLKIRSNTSVNDFAIVDSPGMIDSPRVRSASGAEMQAVMDRGYDFEGVCKWFAQRADVILLFFDPDKPGTTGETLQVLTNSLAGMDHKLLIILNKADQFNKMSDFARAYGSLCWNLSKVIQRKDLPRIYTMCLPPSARAQPGSIHSVSEDRGVGVGGVSSDGSSRGGDWSSLDSDGQGLADLESTREDVIKEVLSAPKRRVLNEISRLADDAQLLAIHYSVLDHLVTKYTKDVWFWRLAISGLAMGVGGAAITSLSLGLPLQVTGGITGVGAMSIAFGGWYMQKSLLDKAYQLSQPESLDTAYRLTTGRVDKTKGGDEFMSSLWGRVREHMILGITKDDIKSIASTLSKVVRKDDINLIKRIIEDDVPALRRRAAPSLYKPKE